MAECPLRLQRPLHITVDGLPTVTSNRAKNGATQPQLPELVLDWIDPESEVEIGAIFPLRILSAKVALLLERFETAGNYRHLE